MVDLDIASRTTSISPLQGDSYDSVYNKRYLLLQVILFPAGWRPGSGVSVLSTLLGTRSNRFLRAIAGILSGIPEYEIVKIARCLFPDILAFYNSKNNKMNLKSEETRNKKEHPLRNSNKVEHRLSGNDMLLVQAVIDDMFVKMFEAVCPK